MCFLAPNTALPSLSSFTSPSLPSSQPQPIAILSLYLCSGLHLSWPLSLSSCSSCHFFLSTFLSLPCPPFPLLYPPFTFFSSPFPFLLHRYCVFLPSPLSLALIPLLSTLCSLSPCPAANKYCIYKNYGNTFIIWDRLLGTFAEEREDEPLTYGIVFQKDNNHLVGLSVGWTGVRYWMAGR